MNLRIAPASYTTLITAGLVLVAIMLAVVVGVGGGLVGWFGQLFLLTVLVPASLVALNYRFGLLALVVLMPFAGAQFIPKVGPLSAVNLLMVGVLTLVAVRLAMKRMLHGTVVLPIPTQFVLLYLLPITVSYLIGTMHLGEIAQHMLEEDGKRDTLRGYWISSYFKNILFALCGLSLAVAVVEYRNAKVFMYTALGSAVLYVLATAAMFSQTSQTLEAAVYSRQMYSATGRHANSVGAMLLPIFAAALYMREAAATRLGQWLLSGVALLLLGGLLLTGSRGAMLGTLVVAAIYLWQHRRLGTFLGAVLVAAVVLLASPAAVTDRLTMGLSDISKLESSEDLGPGEQLTSGRLYLAKQLFPEVLKHPVLGNGMGSTRWSDYAKNGGPIAHPHNMYLLALLDLGIIGSVCVAAFVVYVLRLVRGLAREQALEPMLRAYFAGTFVGIVGYLVFAVSGGTPFPRIDQWFMWVGFGLALGCRVMITGKVNAPGSLPTPGDTAVPKPSRRAAFWTPRPR